MTRSTQSLLQLNEECLLTHVTTWCQTISTFSYVLNCQEQNIWTKACKFVLLRKVMNYKFNYKHELLEGKKRSVVITIYYGSRRSAVRIRQRMKACKEIQTWHTLRSTQINVNKEAIATSLITHIILHKRLIKLFVGLKSYTYKRRLVILNRTINAKQFEF